MKKLVIYCSFLQLFISCGSPTKSNSLKDEKIDIKGEILGDWYWDRNIISQRIILYSDRDSLFLLTIFDDSSKMRTFVRISNDTIFDVEENYHAEFHILKNGNLEYHGNDGKFGEAVPTK
jgi:hypothetical protein